MIVVDKLCYRSGLRYVNAGEKNAFALITLVLCIASRSILTSLVVLSVTSLLTLWKGKIPTREYLKMMMVPLVFLLLSTLAILVDVAKTPGDCYAFAVGGGWYITNSWNQILYGIQLIFTALASVSCLYFLSLNTTMTDILTEFRRMHVPPLLVELMMLIYRYIFILLSVADNIRNSQNSRLGNKDYRTSLHSFGAMISVLFVRAVKKAEAQFNGLEARGYDNAIRVLSEHYPPRKREIAGIAVFEVLLLFFIIWQKVFFH
ncbi:MAG: cobalt ECF transporter T component CbiQ [Lachnospiraceae bacterium]|nr:cobalt ECF transporter T component CbiQ [Lachnospiraceae bacterium]